MKNVTAGRRLHFELEWASRARSLGRATYGSLSYGGVVVRRRRSSARPAAPREFRCSAHSHGISCYPRANFYTLDWEHKVLRYGAENVTFNTNSYVIVSSVFLI